MNMTHRIPWQRLAYGYTEVVYEAHEPVDFARLALDALTMEGSYIASLPGQPQREPERVREPERNDAPRGGYGGQQQARRGPPAPPDPNAPYCREHNAPMKRNRYDNGWFCTRKDRSGNYCTEQVRD